MKEFKIPQMTVVQLSGEDVITGSLCGEFYCNGHRCDDCNNCERAHVCYDFLCNNYEKPDF